MNNKINRKERKFQITATGLIRWSGVFAILAGVLYITIQLIHPSDHISSVGSSMWVIVACLSIMMSLFSLVGITGIYTIQLQKAGWLGIFGYMFFSLFWLASTAFSFIEAFLLPVLKTEAPRFVQGFLGIFGEMASEIPLGLLPSIAPIAGGMYLLGGLLLGIASYRAGILPRPAAALLAFGAVVTLAGAAIPHPLDRILAVPLALAFIWLGYALWSRRTHLH